MTTRAAVPQVDAGGPYLVQEREGGPVWWTDRVLAFRLPFDGLAFGALPPALRGARWELGESTRRDLRRPYGSRRESPSP